MRIGRLKCGLSYFRFSCQSQNERDAFSLEQTAHRVIRLCLRKSERFLPYSANDYIRITFIVIIIIIIINYCHCHELLYHCYIVIMIIIADIIYIHGYTYTYIHVTSPYVYTYIYLHAHTYTHVLLAIRGKWRAMAIPPRHLYLYLKNR